MKNLVKTLIRFLKNYSIPLIGLVVYVGIVLLVMHFYWLEFDVRFVWDLQ